MYTAISVKEELLKYFRRRRPEGYHLPKIGTYHPSLLAKSCLKAQFNHYRISQKTGHFPDSYLLHTHEGRAWHTLIQSLPKVWDKTEAPVKKIIPLRGKGKITIVGRADAVKEDTVYEFKRHNFIKYKADFADVLQLNFYMELLGKPKGMLVVLGYKDSEFTIQEYPWVLSDWHSNIMIDRAIQLHTFLKYDQIPHCACRNKRHDVEYDRWLYESKKRNK